MNEKIVHMHEKFHVAELKKMLKWIAVGERPRDSFDSITQLDSDILRVSVLGPII